MANRAKIVLNVIEILEELKGDIAEKREFLKFINYMVKRTNVAEIATDYIRESK